jgi:hypothetical protein
LRCEADLKDAFEDARRAHCRYACRHIAVNPTVSEPITPDQALDVAQKLAREFDGDPDGYILIEHRKPRAASPGANAHYHLLLPEWNPVTQRVMDARNQYPRNELIARMSEVGFGMEPTRGRHNRAVYEELIKRGQPEIAARIVHLTRGAPALAPYGGQELQRAKRLGWELRDVRQGVQKAWDNAPDQGVFQAELADQGLALRNDRGTWLVLDVGTGEKLGELARLLRQPNQDGRRQLRAHDVYPHLSPNTEEEHPDDRPAPELAPRPRSQGFFRGADSSAKRTNRILDRESRAHGRRGPAEKPDRPGARRTEGSSRPSEQPNFANDASGSNPEYFEPQFSPEWRRQLALDWQRFLIYERARYRPNDVHQIQLTPSPSMGP